ncbi:hypothetical protein [Enhygromyxa salina]|uniref:Uncharacterized protein n=1 Tax=Enhygromyxa salina TaxID=215803 RepID=A0A2S9YTY1_9BACT|nr:hypothetical protein [Enhygromyxa salina]PRQ08571.1 hypothetical protein ENSA7_18570 [Enhygromyxa salina]
MSTALDRATKHPKALARARDATQRQLRRRVKARSAVVVTVWVVMSIALGVLQQGAGSLVHAGWLAIMSVAVLLSPITLLALRRININFKAARLAIAEAEDERASPDHLQGSLANFFTETRLARIGLSDAVEPGEGVRMLWDWRRGYESLAAADREQLAELGVGLGPITSMLAGVESEEVLSDEQRHEAATHLGHVERLLGTPPASMYR